MLQENRSAVLSSTLTNNDLGNVQVCNCNNCNKQDVCKIYDEIKNISSNDGNSYDKLKNSLIKNTIINKYDCLDINIKCSQYELDRNKLNHYAYDNQTSISTHTYASGDPHSTGYATLTNNIEPFNQGK